MNFREINAILTELPLQGSRIQKIHQPDFESLILDIYNPKARFSLFFCLAPGYTRFHTLSEKGEKPQKLQRFSQLLRSRIQGGRILSAEQIGSDRIVRIEIKRSDRLWILWVRLWSGAANVLLTDAAGVIQDCFYRRPKRNEVSGQVFSIEGLGLEQDPQKNSRFQVRELPGAGSFNSRIEAAYRERAVAMDLERLKSQLLKQFDVDEARLLSALDRIPTSTHSPSDNNQLYGDLISSNRHLINKGDDWLEADNYEQPGERVRIKLDPKLNLQQNAQVYYTKAKKRKAATDRYNSENKKIQSGLEALSAYRKSVENETDPAKIRHLLKRTRPEKVSIRGINQPGLTYSSSGFTFYVGRTARENDALLRKWVKGNDYWLHARDYPGSYVFIKSHSGKSIPLDVLTDAGILAAVYSKARSGSLVDVYYTQVKYLRRTKGGKLGLVIPTQEKNLTVRPDPGKIETLRLG